MSNTLEDQFYIRQKGIIDKLLLSSVTIIGCGASGSCIGVLVGKLGCPVIELWDGDTVEIHNLPNQYYPNDSIGKNKATVLKDVIELFTPKELMPSVIAHDEMYIDNDVIGDVVFLCADGLDNRREIYRKIQTHKNVNWLIDTRMGAEYYEVHTVNLNDRDDKKRYYETLTGDDIPLPCTARSVIYNVMSMASLAVTIYTKIVRQGERDYVPKKLSCDLLGVYLNKEYRENESPIISL